jgi:hypothetical protein
VGSEWRGGLAFVLQALYAVLPWSLKLETDGDLLELTELASAVPPKE